MGYKYEKKPDNNKKGFDFKALLGKIKMPKKNVIMISAMSLSVVALAVIAVVIISGMSQGEGITTSTPDEANSGVVGEINGAPVVATPETKEKLSQLDEAKLANPDTMAWLNVGGTNINAAVMQTDDNDYYLRRDENRQESLWGCYFADYYAEFEYGEDMVQNTVIYGHTDPTEDPSAEKFSSLFYYKDIDFLKENPYIYLTVNNDDIIYEIFAVYYTDISFYYIDPQPTNQGFDTFMQEINAKNEFVFENTTVTEQDKLLTLSGCSYIYDTNETGNHRFVVMAKQVTEERDDIQISINQSPERPDPSV